jgi:hypothetical protein
VQLIVQLNYLLLSASALALPGIAGAKFVGRLSKSIANLFLCIGLQHLNITKILNTIVEINLMAGLSKLFFNKKKTGEQI